MDFLILDFENIIHVLGMKIALNSVSDDLEQSESKLNQVRSIQILLIFWIDFEALNLDMILDLELDLVLKI